VFAGIGHAKGMRYVFAGRGLSEVDGEADVELAAGEVVGDGILDVVHVGYLSEVGGEADVELAAGEVVGDGILDVVHVGYPVV